MDLSGDFVINLVKLGFLGFGALIFVMVFTIIIRNDKAKSGNEELRKRFLTFGFAAFALAAVVQILPLFLGARMTVTFSPNFDVRELPKPIILMADQTLEMDKEYPIEGTRTVKIDVDAALQKVRALNETALTVTRTATELAQQVTAPPSQPTITAAEAETLREASSNLSAAVLEGHALVIERDKERFEAIARSIPSFSPF